MDTKTKTEGARLLQNKIKKLGRKRVTHELMIGDSTLDHWLSGRRIPRLELAIRMKKTLKINPASWLVEPKITSC